MVARTKATHRSSRKKSQRLRRLSAPRAKSKRKRKRRSEFDVCQIVLVKA